MARFTVAFDQPIRVAFDADWSEDAVYIWLEPATMFAFASDPSSVAAVRPA